MDKFKFWTIASYIAAFALITFGMLEILIGANFFRIMIGTCAMFAIYAINELMREHRKTDTRAQCPHNDPNCSFGSGSCDCCR